ncbi:MAG: hypothetical protein ACI4VO_02495, partial [Clostridia bacterium]
IGGWVPIWETIDIELFSDLEGRRKKIILKRLLESEIISMTGFKVVSVNVKVQGVEDNTESEIEKSSEDIAKNETTEEE